MRCDKSIFKAYDIRGVSGVSLTEDIFAAIGAVLARVYIAQGQTRVAVACDGRLSSPAYKEALIRGLVTAPVTVEDIGAVASPVAYYRSLQTTEGNALVITASHNPKDYNGLKVMVKGLPFYGDDLKQLGEDVEALDALPSQVLGRVEVDNNAERQYLEALFSDIACERPIRVAFDCGNGITGQIARRIFEKIGAKATGLYETVDGRFPNHEADPSKAPNLADLIKTVCEGDFEIGIAFDGDGDRIGVVTKAGHIIHPDRLLMLFAKDCLSREKGAKIVYDIKCSRRLTEVIEKAGGIPFMSPTGHSFIQKAVVEEKAPLGGEMSGHIFFNDARAFGFDDGMYAAARLLEIVSRCPDASAELEGLPDAVNTPEIQIAAPDAHARVAAIQEKARFKGNPIVRTIDGIRLDFEDGFALCRASNTTPVLVLRLEGDDRVSLLRIARIFSEGLEPFSPGITQILEEKLCL